MKKTILILLLLAGYFANAQKCSDYFYMQNNKTIEITITNKKGKESGKNIYKISNVNKSGSTTTATINSEMLDKNGKSVAKATNSVECVNGTLMMDMKMFISGPQQEQMGDVSASTDKAYIEYPGNMKEGDALKDGDFSMDFKSNTGMNGKVTVSLTNRKVEGKESVTTPAGTWDCFRITYHSKVSIKLMGIGIPINADVTEWYAPGFGVVKTEANGAKTEITAIR